MPSNLQPLKDLLYTTLLNWRLFWISPSQTIHFGLDSQLGWLPALDLTTAWKGTQFGPNPACFWLPFHIFSVMHLLLFFQKTAYIFTCISHVVWLQGSLTWRNWDRHNQHKQPVNVVHLPLLNWALALLFIFPLHFLNKDTDDYRWMDIATIPSYFPLLSVYLNILNK